MPAALTREPRIRQLLPLAIAERWGVRRLAREARIGYAAAGEALRFIQQQPATEAQAEGAAMLAESAAEIRQSVARAVSGLVGRVEVAAGDVKRKMNAASVERLSVAMEAALRIADKLDGLGHVQQAELALIKRADGQAVGEMLFGGRDQEPDDSRMTADDVLANYPRIEKSLSGRMLDALPSS